jgi:hypothetical protein
MIVVRLLASRRRPWPQPPILVRGASHGATPEVLDGRTQRRRTDVGFGLAGHAVWLRHAAPVMPEARGLSQQRPALAQAHGEGPPASRRLDAECGSAAASWAQPWRGLVTAEGMAAGDHPRCVVTAFTAPPPHQGDDDRYGARGQCENASTAIKGTLRRDRTAATPWLANTMRLLLWCAASVLPHALRTHTLAHTALATAHPATVSLPRVTVAAQIKQYQDRMLLHLPPSCPVNALLPRVTTRLAALPVPALHTS